MSKRQAQRADLSKASLFPSSGCLVFSHHGPRDPRERLTVTVNLCCLLPVTNILQERQHHELCGDRLLSLWWRMVRSEYLFKMHSGRNEDGRLFTHDKHEEKPGQGLIASFERLPCVFIIAGLLLRSSNFPSIVSDADSSSRFPGTLSASILTGAAEDWNRG